MENQYILKHVCPNDLRKGSHIVFENRPYKILDLTRSKPGKHGHAKTTIRMEDLFTGKKKDTILQSNSNVTEPIVNKVTYDVLSLTDGFVSVYDPKTQQPLEIKIRDKDLEEQLKTDLETSDQTFNVIVLQSMGENLVIDYKISNNKDY